MDPESFDNIPWHLIVASFQEECSPEESVQLADWLAASSNNQEKYDQLYKLWHTDINGFSVYQAANETDAWLALQEKMNTSASLSTSQAPVINGNFNRFRQLRKWIAVAALFLLIVTGILFWNRYDQNKEVYYTTAENESKKIILPDGSAVVLQGSGEIRVAADYNRQNRTVTLLKGSASFDVIHMPGLPFMVNMGASSVKDIGTSFSIVRTGSEIKVMVTSGKVAFIKNQTQESNELSAGMAISFNEATLRFGEIESVSLDTNSDNNPLNFNNASLADVITVIQKTYNKRIELMGSPQLAQKKLKADLIGLSYERAIQVVCTSLNLAYSEKNGVTLLKEKEAGSHESN